MKSKNIAPVQNKLDRKIRNRAVKSFLKSDFDVFLLKEANPCKRENGNAEKLAASTKVAARVKANVVYGVAPAKDSRIFVLSFAGKRGQKSLEALQKHDAKKILPRTVTIKTPSGINLLFRVPKGHATRSIIRFLPGVSVRNWRWITVGPGSRDAAGTLFQFEKGQELSAMNIQESPKWLIQEIGAARRKISSLAPKIDHPSRVPVADLKIKGRSRNESPIQLRALANSMADVGQQQPITYRVMNGRKIIVSGRRRWRAAKLLHLDSIAAVELHGNKIQARLSEIAANLHHLELTVLERAELYTEWMQLREQLVKFGQNVHKTKGPGRPKGGLAQAALELPIPGKTAEAKRKVLSRCKKIVEFLAPRSKELMRVAGLDNHGAALQELAKIQKGEQHRHVARLRQKYLDASVQHRAARNSEMCQESREKLKRAWAGSKFAKAWDEAEPYARLDYATSLRKEAASLLPKIARNKNYPKHLEKDMFGSEKWRNRDPKAQVQTTN